MWEMGVQSLGWGDPLEKRMATCTPVFLPGVFHGQRSLVGYSPWSHKESVMTEWLTLSKDGGRRAISTLPHTHTHAHTHTVQANALILSPRGKQSQLCPYSWTLFPFKWCLWWMVHLLCTCSRFCSLSLIHFLWLSKVLFNINHPIHLGLPR